MRCRRRTRMRRLHASMRELCQICMGMRRAAAPLQWRPRPTLAGSCRRAAAYLLGPRSPSPLARQRLVGQSRCRSDRRRRRREPPDFRARATCRPLSLRELPHSTRKSCPARPRPHLRPARGQSLRRGRGALACQRRRARHPAASKPRRELRDRRPPRSGPCDGLAPLRKEHARMHVVPRLDATRRKCAIMPEVLDQDLSEIQRMREI